MTITHGTLKRFGGVLLAAALFVALPVALWSQADPDAPGGESDLADQSDPGEEQEVADEPEEVQEPAESELEEYAEVQVVVVEQQLELQEALSEIAEETGLSGEEITTAEQALNAAGGDPQAVDEAYLEDERYAAAIPDIASARIQAGDAIDRAVAASTLDRDRFEELTILISHDRRLSAETNALVSEKLEDAGVIEEPQIEVPDPQDESPDTDTQADDDQGIQVPDQPGAGD